MPIIKANYYSPKSSDVHAYMNLVQSLYLNHQKQIWAKDHLLAFGEHVWQYLSE